MAGWADYIEPGSPDPGLLDEDWLRWRLAQLPAEPTQQTTPTVQQLTMPSGFRPAVSTGGGLLGLPGGLMSAEQADAMREGSLDLFSQAAMLGGAPTPASAEARQLALGRTRTPRSPLPPRLAARVTDVPEFDPAATPYAQPGEPLLPVPEGVPTRGLGDNNPPVRNAIWAAPQTRGAAKTTLGRMGSNADKTLEELGLPAYADIVPSTNTGPVSADVVKSVAGSPVRPGNVFDLSDTWQVPDVPQEGLLRIDPDAGRRKGLPDHIVNVTTDPDMRGKLRTVAEAGLKAGGAYWYNAEPLRQAFVTELGPDEGNKTFAQYMRTIGAVSAGSAVDQNIRTASYYNVRERQGNPVQGVKIPKGWAPTDIENPYGHKLQNTQYGAYRDIAGGDPLDPEMRPKRASFDANLSGNQQPVTVDKHNLRLIGMLSQDPEFLKTKTTAEDNYPVAGVNKGDSINWREAVKSGRLTMDQVLRVPQAWDEVPKANHYAALEQFQQNLANEMGISPAQLQAALWVGGGRVTGLKSLPTSFMGAFEGKLQNTAALRGGSPMRALLDFVHGKKPLLTPLAAGGAAASLLYPEEQQQ